MQKAGAFMLHGGKASWHWEHKQTSAVHLIVSNEVLCEHNHMQHMSPRICSQPKYL